MRRLALKAPIARLCRVARADYWGRTTPDALALTDSRTIPEIVWLLEKAKFVKVEDGKPVAILMGRHLLEKGMKPGKEMGIVLAAAFEAQLDGLFDTLVWCRRMAYETSIQ